MHNFNVRFVCYILGLLMTIESAFMGLATVVALLYGESDLWAMGLSMLITLAVGVGAMFFTRHHDRVMKKREGFFIVAITWFVFSFFGMLPFVLTGAIPSLTDAFFETMSGFTTTGASILNDIESLSHGLLFWRSLIQWIGGMGIIVFTVALLPKLGVSGGVHLFNSEAPGLTHEKIMPRIDQTAKRLWLIYLLITLVLTLLLWAGPMGLFDAVCHALTAMATGGYSTKQASIAYWNSAYVDYVITFFMFIAGTNFTLVYLVGHGKLSKLFKDEEFRWYISIVLIATLCFTFHLWAMGYYDSFFKSLQMSVFQVVSILTTTGFATADYVDWGGFCWIMTLILMVVGGSAGSTAGGMKIVRVLVILKNTRNEFRKQLYPTAFTPVRVSKNVVPYELVTKVLAFLFLYLLLLLLGVCLLTLLGVDFDQSVGAVITSISNVGPGLGLSGPSGNFADFPVAGKWVMSLLMMIGRLELFTVLVLFTPAFWRK